MRLSETCAPPHTDGCVGKDEHGYVCRCACHQPARGAAAVPFEEWARARQAPLYPVVITATRYQGSYEGGSWAAFNLYSHQLPVDHDGSDIECMEFWRGAEADRVGRGNNPQEALDDLVERVKVHGENQRLRGE